jgi:hypothetical protein
VIGSDGLPVVGATVFLLSADSTVIQATITDSVGYFVFNNEVNSPFLIKIQHLNFVEFENSFANKNIGIIILSEKTQDLNEVVVRGEKPLVQINNGILTYNVQRLIENKTVSTVYEALQKLPGVREENEKLTLAGAGSFAILIDGKPSTMSAEQIYQLLKSMPANSIEKAELMYSAPPQYHVGSGAAVNLITKRGLLESVNGQVNAGYEQKKYANYNVGASLFYNSDKVYSDFLYAFNHAKNRSGLDLESMHTVDNQTYNITQQNRGINGSNNHNIRAGIDYNIAEQKSISAVYTAQIASKSYSEETSRGTFADSETFGGLTKPTQMHNIGLHYNAQDWGLKAGANFTTYGLASQRTYINAAEQFSVDAAQNVKHLNIYADKTHTLKSNWTIGYGLQYAVSGNRSEQEYSAASGLTDYNSEISQNEYTYNTYFRFSKMFSQQFNLSASLTGEYYEYGINDRFNFYPQLTAAYYSKNYNHIFQLNLVADKKYPQYWEMSNFTSYINDYTVAVGNPYLRPNINYSAYLTYVLQQKYSFTLFSSYIDKYFVQLPYQSTKELQLIYQTTNFDYLQQTGLSVTVPFTVKFFDTQLNINTYYQQNKHANFHDIAFEKDLLSAYVSADNNFTLCQKPKLVLNVQGYYITNSLQGAGIIPSAVWLNAGLKFILLKEKGEILLRANDIFNSQPRGMKLLYNTQNLTMNVFPDYRAVALTFTYKFGKNFTPKERKEVDTSRFGTNEK